MLGRNCGSVDHYEGRVGARRMSVNSSRRKLLAAAGRADNENTAVRRRYFLDRLAQLIDRWRMSNQRGGERSELLELPHLALKPRILECAFGDQQQTIGLERLFDEIIGAALDRGHRGFDIAMARNHDDRQFRMLLLETVEQLQAIKPAALQPNIEENEIGPARNYG